MSGIKTNSPKMPRLILWPKHWVNVPFTKLHLHGLAYNLVGSIERGGSLFWRWDRETQQ